MVHFYKYIYFLEFTNILMCVSSSIFNEKVTYCDTVIALIIERDKFWNAGQMFQNLNVTILISFQLHFDLEIPSGQHGGARSYFKLIPSCIIKIENIYIHISTLIDSLLENINFDKLWMCQILNIYVFHIFFYFIFLKMGHSNVSCRR